MAGKSFKTQIKPTFKATVQVPRIGAEPMAISFVFKAFDRVSLARIFDNWKKQNLELIKEAEDAAETGSEFSLEDWAEREIEIQVKQVKDIVEGWGFDDEFNDENIREVVSSSVSVTDAILEQYNEAYNRARSGN